MNVVMEHSNGNNNALCIMLSCCAHFTSPIALHFAYHHIVMICHKQNLQTKIVPTQWLQELDNIEEKIEFR